MSHRIAEQRAKLRANSGLRKEEEWWVKHQPFLRSRDYFLRPRYDPNWTPTWEENEEMWPHLCEDSLPIRIVCFWFNTPYFLLLYFFFIQPGNVLDAVRRKKVKVNNVEVVEDLKVVLKLVSSRREMHISYFLGEYLPAMFPNQKKPNRSVVGDDKFSRRKSCG